MSEKPVRLQLSRKRGFNLQELSRATNGLEAVNVARPSAFGNPFVVGKPGGVYTRLVKDRRHAYLLFKSIASDTEALVKAAREQLAGKNLACWCPNDDPYEDCCHAAVLLEIANALPSQSQERE